MSVAPATSPLKNATAPGRRPSDDVAPMLPADRFVVALLCATAIVAPVMVGSTGEWPRLGVEAAMTAAVATWAVSGRQHWLALAIPPAIAALFLPQLLPLPDRLLDRIAPLSASAWKVATQGHPGTAGSISIVPAATLVACCRLLLGLATVAVVADLARRRPARRWLLWSLAASAVLVVSLGVVFPVGYSEKVLIGLIDLKGPIEFWRSPLPPPAQTAGWGYLDWNVVGEQRYPVDLRLVGDGFGPFISTNEFAAAVHLALPAVLALVVVLTRKRLPLPVHSVILILLAAGAAWVVGGMARSRAGVASLLFGALVFLTLSEESPRVRRVGGVATGMLAAALLAFVLAFHGCLEFVLRACPESWRTRLVEMGADGRVLASQVALRMFRASPVFGTGLNSYGDQHARMAGVGQAWYFAHNDYAQFLAEGGIAALVVLAVAAALLVAALRRFLAVPAGVDRMEIAAGWAALAAILLHSAFDWNMHVPANAFLASLAAGLVLTTLMPGTVRPHTVARNGGPAKLGHRVATGALVAACLLSLAILARQASSEAAARSLREAIVAEQLAVKDPARPDPVPVMLAAVARGEVAAARDPANASLAVCLGQANLHLAARATDLAADAYRATATRWFDRARTSAPAIRGFPEPLPKPAPKPAQTP